MHKSKGATQPPSCLTYLSKVIENYGNALIHGNKYIYQTMPRLLTLWFDNGQIFAKHKKQYPKVINDELAKVNQLMINFQKQIPTSLWLTSFPQLVSSICHDTVFDILEKILSSVLCDYRHQAFWGIVAVTKSTVGDRQRRAQDIFANAKKSSKNMKTFLDKASLLCEKLLQICNYPVTSETQLSIKKQREFKDLMNMTPMDIILPLQSSLTVTLPPDGLNHQNHQPFPNELVTIECFHDNIDIMSSLIKPRKITITGNDGFDYMFLCKPKDDLRKDARMMDFNNILNKLLKKNPESRRRNLHIRTYAVIPLNETCGLIEWVENTTGYRHILTKLMNQHYPKTLNVCFTIYLILFF